MKGNVDFICTSHPISQQLPLFATVFSSLLIVCSVPINVIIFITINKYPHLLYRSFYLIIGNIALADSVAAVLVCPLSVSFHMKEALNVTIPTTETEMVHFTFFTTNQVSVFSMTLLSIDRLGVLYNPFLYYEKFTRSRTIIILFLTWLSSGSIATVYFRFGYIRFLGIFATTTVMVAALFIIATVVLFKLRLRQSETPDIGKISNNIGQLTVENNRAKKERQTLNNFTQMDKEITKTFIWMLILFLVNYLPAVCVTWYMNFCGDWCDCTFVHIMRDFVFLSILSSGLIRALNFLICLKTLREAIKFVIPFNKRNHGENLAFHSNEFR